MKFFISLVIKNFIFKFDYAVQITTVFRKSKLPRSGSKIVSI